MKFSEISLVTKGTRKRALLTAPAETKFFAKIIAVTDKWDSTEKSSPICFAIWRTRRGSSSFSDVSSPYELVFVKNTSATTCYGYKVRVREKPSAPPPPSPYDLFIRHSEIRVYNRPGDTKLRLSSKPEMVYFHPLSPV